MLIGVLIGFSRLAYDTAYPLLVGFSTIPKVAVVPIFVLWFGAGTVPAVLTAMILCIFPIVVNVARAAIRKARERARMVAKPERADAIANAESLGRMIRIAVPGA